MILALILSFAAALSSAPLAAPADSLAASAASLVPYNASRTSAIAIPEPNYRPPDTTIRKWEGVGSAPTPKEQVPGFVTRTLYSVALLTSGVLLTGAGIVYWQHAQAANDAVQKAGVNPFALMAVATISIPVGAVVTVFGGLSLIGDIGSIGKSGGDPDRE